MENDVEVVGFGFGCGFGGVGRDLVWCLVGCCFCGDLGRGLWIWMDMDVRGSVGEGGMLGAISLGVDRA